ncbi:MAG: hypothetical protein JWL62_1169 [Hyphomicrobiales bacterium]|nr:hypothetical protein [Hyphomicrobiales bacterium]
MIQRPVIANRSDFRRHGLHVRLPRETGLDVLPRLTTSCGNAFRENGRGRCDMQDDNGKSHSLSIFYNRPRRVGDDNVARCEIVAQGDWQSVAKTMRAPVQQKAALVSDLIEFARRDGVVIFVPSNSRDHAACKHKAIIVSEIGTRPVEKRILAGARGPDHEDELARNY